MKERTEMGVNRTGVQMSPIEFNEMSSGSHVIPSPSGDESAIVDIRSSYFNEADKLGSVPLPGTFRGAVKTGIAIITGESPQLLLDKLGERLAFERAGTRLYEALIAKVEALGQNGIYKVSSEMLRKIRAEEAEHAALVANAIVDLGGDPTSMTPCADLVGVESMGLMQVLTDPRTTVAQSLHAILVAEMVDNNSWETLISLAESQGQGAIATEFRAALVSERDHLKQVQQWVDEAILGSSSSAIESDSSDESAPLH